MALEILGNLGVDSAIPVIWLIEEKLGEKIWWRKAKKRRKL
jgi:hypothetical protein